MMDVLAFIFFCMLAFTAYTTYKRNPSLFSAKHIDQSLLVFGVLVLFLMLVIGLGVLSIRGI